MDLDNLKYSELQKLAKGAGIRANLKVEKLVKALKEYYSNQKQSDDDSQISKSDGNLSTQSAPSSSSAEEDHSPEENTESDDVKDDTTKKKAATRGRKKGKKGTRGKNKKNSSSEESESLENMQKSVTPKSKSSASVVTVSTPKQAVPAAGHTPSSKRATPTATSGGRKTPTIVKPVSAKTMKDKITGAKKTSVTMKHTPTKTPGKDSKNFTPGTPSLFSPRPNTKPGSVGSKAVASKTTKHSKKRTPPGTASGKRSTPASGGTKRRSSQNPAEEENQPEAKRKTPPANTGHKRKRKDTFELEGPTLDSTATPEAERTTKRAKVSSGTEQQATRAEGSPGVQDMIDSMSGDIGSAERRNQLMNAINKKVEGKVKTSQAGPVTQIPRFAAFLAKKKQEQKKPITPGNKDWEKVHKKEFSKFDSIDVYLEKKRKRMEDMTASVKKTRTVLHEVQQAVTKLKSKRTPSLGRKKAEEPFKPSVMSTKNMNLNFNAMASKKTPSDRKSAGTSKPFKPTVTSTKNMNLNFSSLKTPLNGKEPAKATPASSKAKNIQSARKSVGGNHAADRKSLGTSAARKSLSTTPFHFTGNLNTTDAAKSTSKPVFDLKASLARPITWKPHTGKLKPLESLYSSSGKGIASSASKPTVSHMDIFKSAVNKTRKTYSRQDKRAAVAARRAEKKNDFQMKRRGITVSP